ncbi:unnamed protein product [Oikopleura dioica]|uniref:Uncharacterized protein n=1 Tax=Oikopleura dioica TaxID=34765 RepID=E4XBT8_OIKDI|nr:unnamed protein product [Oikopleura dioica]
MWFSNGNVLRLFSFYCHVANLTKRDRLCLEVKELTCSLFFFLLKIFSTRLALRGQSPTDRMTAQIVASAHNDVATATSA